VTKAGLFFGVLSRTRHGSLEVITPDGEIHRFCGEATGEKATIRLQDWSVIDAIAASGDIGLGETYMDGLWETDDLQSLLAFCQRNRDEFGRLTRSSGLNRILSRLARYKSRNSLAGSRENMAAAYDYPPELFRAYTDEMMTYSSGWWDGQEMSLDEAQLNKYERILSRVGDPPKHILEMGCGWGYFLKLAADRGYRVTGCTVSRRQYEYARELNANAIAQGRVTLLLDDYRNMPGRYDAVTSTGFFEHVGSAYWVEHFRKVKQYLKQGGVCMIQTMVTNRHSPDSTGKLTFFSKHIFPGGEFPSVGTFIVAAEEAGLRCAEQLAFGQDYARTMSEAWKNFQRNREDLRKLGFDAKFIRKWEFFLAGWYAMFASGQCNVMQAKLVHYP
jgi:cyclopropane-fatty-acyl-phospholipid synthase